MTNEIFLMTNEKDYEMTNEKDYEMTNEKLEIRNGHYFHF